MKLFKTNKWKIRIPVIGKCRLKKCKRNFIIKMIYKLFTTRKCKNCKYFEYARFPKINAENFSRII